MTDIRERAARGYLDRVCDILNHATGCRENWCPDDQRVFDLVSEMVVELCSLKSNAAISAIQYREIREALRSAYAFVDDNVRYSSGDHENPPEPFDSFSYDAQPLLASIQRALAEDHATIRAALAKEGALNE